LKFQNSGLMTGQTGFLEKDFALAMESLEARLAEIPGWRELIKYRDISSLDAGYLDFYLKFLEILRNQDEPELAASTFHRTVGVKNILKKLAYFFKMHMAPLPLPTLGAQHKALVVRSFGNTSPFPVLKQLANDPAWGVLFASWNPRLEKSVAEIGIPFIQLEDTYRGKYTEIRKHHTSTVKKLMAHIDPGLPIKLLNDMLNIQVQYDARSFLEEIIVRIRTYTDVYFDLIAGVKPDVVILLNEISLSDRLAGLVSAQIGTPSISIQHGLYIGYAYRKLATDKVIVWGTEPKKFWEKRGCKPEQVISVGSFAHEKWRTLIEKKRTALPGDGRPKIFFLGQNPAAFISAHTHRKTIAAVFSAVQSLPEYHFIIKPHPAENPEPYHAAYNKLASNSNVKIRKTGSVEDVILQSDLVITVFSTAGLEAMLLGKPVIVLNLSQEPSMAPYVPAAHLVESTELLPQAIQQIMEDTEQQQALVSAGKKYANEYFGIIDGHAADRAVRVIQDLVEAPTA
jgi:glycosyltransferase involved in cell wall biosynthesis